MKQIVLGIPKGSLQESTINLFRQSGWRISLTSRNYFPEVNDPEISCAICRAQEMSRYVESGTFDAGLTARDWILENDSEVVVVADLIYSKVSQRPARWVLAVPYDSPVKELKDQREENRHRTGQFHPSLFQRPEHRCPSRVLLGCD